MANFDTIKTTIDANINANGNQAITGAVMNSVLKQMVDSTDAELTELESEVDFTKNRIELSMQASEFGADGWYNSNGVIMANAYRNATKPIKVKKGDVFEYSLNAGLNMMMIAALDDNKNCIISSSLVGQDHTAKGIFIVDENTSYIVAQNYNADTTDGCYIRLVNSIISLIEKNSDGINKVSKSIVLRNEAEASEVLGGIFINSNGVLSNGSDAYKCIKIECHGQYLVNSNEAGTQQTLWEYEDAECSQPKKVIIGNAPFNGVLNLEGFYAFAWNTTYTENPILIKYGDIVDTNPKPSLNYKLVTSYMLTKATNYKANRSEILSQETQFNTDWDESLFKSDGSITHSSYRYKSSKIKVSVGDVYAYNLCIDPQFMAVAALDLNGDCITEKSVVGIDSNQYNVYIVQEGVEFLQFQSKLVSSNLAPNYLYLSNIERNKNIGSGIMKLDGWNWLNGNNSFTIYDNLTWAKSAAAGYENRMSFITEMFQDTFRYSIQINPTMANEDGHWEFCMGTELGVIASVGADESGQFAKLYTISNGSLVEEKREDLSSMRFGIGKPFSIIFNKTPDTIYGFTMSVIDSKGDEITIENIESIRSTMNSKPCFFANTGEAEFGNISFGYNVDIDNIKVVVMGHSFVEGSTMIDAPKTRFASRLRQEIGEKNVAILGQGGIGVSNLLRNCLISLSWLRNAKYVVIYIGYNDADDTIITSQMQVLNNVINALGMIPIWITPSPTRDGNLDPKPKQKQYMMKYFNYVDVTQAFLDESGNPDPTMYHDNVHPSSIGHERIYNLLKGKFGCMFVA